MLVGSFLPRKHAEDRPPPPVTKSRQVRRPFRTSLSQRERESSGSSSATKAGETWSSTTAKAASPPHAAPAGTEGVCVSTPLPFHHPPPAQAERVLLGRSAEISAKGAGSKSRELGPCRDSSYGHLAPLLLLGFPGHQYCGPEKRECREPGAFPPA